MTCVSVSSEIDVVMETNVEGKPALVLDISLIEEAELYDELEYELGDKLEVELEAKLLEAKLDNTLEDTLDDEEVELNFGDDDDEIAAEDDDEIKIEFKDGSDNDDDKLKVLLEEKLFEEPELDNSLDDELDGDEVELKFDDADAAAAEGDAGIELEFEDDAIDDEVLKLELKLK
jgi:hypothetical protein